VNDDATATGPFRTGEDADAEAGTGMTGEGPVAPTMRATVLVRPKEGILDPQGQAVRDSLRKLGFAVEEVHVGRVIEVELEAASPDEANAQLDAMCRQLLTNPLIETHEIRLAGAEPAPQLQATHEGASLDATG